MYFFYFLELLKYIKKYMKIKIKNNKKITNLLGGTPNGHYWAVAWHKSLYYCPWANNSRRLIWFKLNTTYA